jgi:hypothetical protein
LENDGSVELPPVGMGAQPVKAIAASNAGRAWAGRQAERSRDFFMMRYLLLSGFAMPPRARQAREKAKCNVLTFARPASDAWLVDNAPRACTHLLDTAQR